MDPAPPISFWRSGGEGVFFFVALVLLLALAGVLVLLGALGVAFLLVLGGWVAGEPFRVFQAVNSLRE